MAVLSLQTVPEVGARCPRTDEELLLKITALNILKISSREEHGRAGIKHCPFLKGALRDDVVWIAQLLSRDWQEVEDTALAFLPDFLALEPVGNADRAVVIVLPHLRGVDDRAMGKNLDNLNTAMGLGGYYQAGLMPGSLSLPVPPPPQAKFLLPLLIVRHMVREDDTFLREASVNPAKREAATAAYRRLFNREP